MPRLQPICDMGEEMSHSELTPCPRCFAMVMVNMMEEHLTWHDVVNKYLNNRAPINREDKADV